MNKAGANTVYVVLVVALILTASAKESSAQPVYVLRACIAAQLSLNADDNSGGTSHAGTLPSLRNIGTEVSGADAATELRWAPDQVYGNSQSVSLASIEIFFADNPIRVLLINRFWAPSGEDAKYRFAYLKRDLVYVRSKS